MAPNPTKQRLIGLLRYVEELASLLDATVFSVRSYRTLRFLEHELQNRVGIQHDVASPEGAIWIRIERIHRHDPPVPNPVIAPWLVINRDPNQQPEVLTTRLEQGMKRAEARKLVEEGKVEQADIMQSPHGDGLVDVRLRLDWLPDVKEAIDKYISGPWQKWSDEEKPRRETIAIYDRLFSVVQLIESSGAENPTEVVLGIGMMLWETEGKRLEHPLIEMLVEIDIDPISHAIRVRPRESDPQIYVKPLVELGNVGVKRLSQFAKEHFNRLRNGRAEDAVTDDLEISPFERRSFEPVLQQATAVLSTGRYYPDYASNPSDRSLPDISDCLTITDTWAIYARPRSGNLYVQDVQRLKEAVEEAETLPPSAERLVSEAPDDITDLGIDLQNVIGAAEPYAGNDLIDTEDRNPDVLFPKPFNDAQVEIIRRLEKQEGVVVQGPPGTGKTHTIANVICHYLATGRSVLVVSKGEPALEVLRDQIPKGIRDLTISLLTNEREGLKQLETAVTCMANEVANKNARRLERDRRDREAEILRLRERIGEIDKRVCHLAKLQLESVPDLNVLPAELAQHIVANAEKHTWLPDGLGHEDEYTPQFSNEDVHALGRARRSLAADIAYIDCSLPSPSDLPDTSSVCAIHRDLVRAGALAETAEKNRWPRMSTRSPNSIAEAELLLAELRDVYSALQLMTQPEHVWLWPYYETWLTRGRYSESSQLFELMVEEIRRLVEERRPFKRLPVQLPPLGEMRENIYLAVQRAMHGSRPFSILSLGMRNAREAFASIKVAADAPRTPSDWKHVADFLAFQDKVAAFVVKWNGLAQESGLPTAPEEFHETITWMSQLLENVDAVLSSALRYREMSRATIECLFPQGINADTIPCDKGKADRAIRLLETSIATEKLSSARSGVQSAVDRLQTCSGQIVEEMLGFLRNSVGHSAETDHAIADRWQDLVRELKRVQSLRPEMELILRIADLIESSGAPIWASRLRTDAVTGNSDPWTPELWQETWRFRRLDAYLREIDCRDELKQLADERVKCEHSLTRAMTEIVRLRTYLGLQNRLGRGGRLAALQQFVTAIRKIGAGTGIRARRYRGDARRAMAKCIEAVPCWIMPTWRASESLPPAVGAFDLVIVDEASQSDAMALPALIRAKKLLIVGDDRQVSPSPVGIEERKLLQLRHSFLEDQPFADLLMPGSSLYELALAAFPGERVLLNEHFRCVEPIIRFSFQFYPEKIEPVRIPKPSERLDPPLVDVYLPHGERDKRKINVSAHHGHS